MMINHPKGNSHPEMTNLLSFTHLQSCQSAFLSWNRKGEIVNIHGAYFNTVNGVTKGCQVPKREFSEAIQYLFQE